MTTNGQLGTVVKRLLTLRDWSSPEMLDFSFRPDKPPVSADTIRRIRDGKDLCNRGEKDELKLRRLASMLKLPLTTLVLVHAGDTEALARLDFGPDDEYIKQEILELMSAPTPARKRNQEAS
jgi:hypothetical protein